VLPLLSLLTFPNARYVSSTSIKRLDARADKHQLQCFLTALSSDNCAELTDFKCHCEKSDALLSSVTPCVQDACSADDQASVIAGVKKTCAAAGVSISVPEPSSAVPESSYPTPESTSAAESSSAEPSSVVVSSTEVLTVTSVASTVSYTATVTATSSASGVPLPSANGTVPTGTPAPTTSEFPGAASRIGAAAGLVGAAALAVFAL
jgi:hypothetical protein